MYYDSSRHADNTKVIFQSPRSIAGRLTTVLAALGVILLLGGLGHSIGVTRLYFMAGLPDANRTLLDLWIAEAQLLAGALYVIAARSARKGGDWRALAAFGVAVTVGFAAPIIPLLLSRAPLFFALAPISYLLVSVYILVNLTRLKTTGQDGSSSRTGASSQWS